MGGKCIYCGQREVDSEHLASCGAYKEQQREEEEGRLKEDEPKTVVADSGVGVGKDTTVCASATTNIAGVSPIAVAVDENFGAAIGRGAKRGPPQLQNNPKTPSEPNQISCSSAFNLVTPHGDILQGVSAKKLKPKVDEFVVCCLTCGTPACPYESGYSIMKPGDGDEREFDPAEPPLNATLKQPLAFDKLKSPIRVVIGGIVYSKKIWSNHKFIGSSHLDLKLQTWMRNRLNAPLVDNNWPPLRRAVKELLRYKRQRSVDLIREAFFGETVISYSIRFCIRPRC